MNDSLDVKNADTHLELAWTCALVLLNGFSIINAQTFIRGKTADKMLGYEILVFWRLQLVDHCSQVSSFRILDRPINVA